MKSLEDTHSPITANRGFYHFRSLAARHNQVTTRFAAWESAADASTTAAHTASFGIRSRFISPTGIVRVAELGNEPAEKARQLSTRHFTSRHSTSVLVPIVSVTFTTIIPVIQRVIIDIGADNGVHGPRWAKVKFWWFSRHGRKRRSKIRRLTALRQMIVASRA